MKMQITANLYIKLYLLVNRSLRHSQSPPCCPFHVTQSRNDDLIGKIQALLKSFEEVEDGDGEGSFPFELSGVGNVLKGCIDKLRRPCSEVLFVSFLEHFLL
jgi:hypothetical protein